MCLEDLNQEVYPQKWRHFINCAIKSIFGRLGISGKPNAQPGLCFSFICAFSYISCLQKRHSCNSIAYLITMQLFWWLAGQLFKQRNEKKHVFKSVLWAVNHVKNCNWCYKMTKWKNLTFSLNPNYIIFPF